MCWRWTAWWRLAECWRGGSLSPPWPREGWGGESGQTGNFVIMTNIPAPPLGITCGSQARTQRPRTRGEPPPRSTEWSTRTTSPATSPTPWWETIPCCPWNLQQRSKTGRYQSCSASDHLQERALRVGLSGVQEELRRASAGGVVEVPGDQTLPHDK